ncbi:tetratricopeptide repeat-containing sulfotransferase family protein [Novosphingobium piscinae]|uniref:Sulfotransferase n=1 Tax=Novosphingobium piscinae TaxID=1507448 RepID=A0A7X1KPW8_9SPHN|nr:sulfotransferase [Novosphingobium piscinae]MBC2668865.1 sulfotransferase [Novosphingobium piscinae]
MTNPLDRAAAALADQPAVAERLARMLVTQQPGDPRPRLILASALRRLGRADQALPLLSDLARAFPQAARTRYELGLSLAALSRDREADRELDHAVRLDPNLGPAWEAIEQRAFAAGDGQRERRAQAALARIDAGDPELGRAAELVVLERFGEAEPLLRRFCLAQPDHPEGLRLMAACQVAARGFAAAETLLNHALSRAPGSRRIRFDLAHALFAGRRAEPALAALAPLLEADPDNAAYRNLLAACLGLLGDDRGAEAINAELAAAFPHNPRIAVNHAHAARTAGERERAIAAYRRAIALHPRGGEAWWGLANLKVGALTTEDETSLRTLLAADLPDDERMRIEYALARRLEDAGKADEAMDHYARGAALARTRFAYGQRDYPAELAATRTTFTPAFLAARAGWGCLDPAPIFVVGLPRSGSTLVEQILASHPAIEGTMELPYMGILAGEIEAGGPAALAAAGPTEVRAWGERYLASAKIHRRLGRTHFIDKMPNNFRHIGLIRLVLPQARIVDVRRHPMAACFSGFKQLFAEGQEFSYDLGDLGRYYRHYLATVRHFVGAAPGAVHTLLYEDLIEDTEREVRQLLAYLGLPFDPACLRFFENDRAVRTVSSEQVRQPIYRSGLDHWRAFEPWLGPLAEALGEDRTNWRETAPLPPL